MRKIWWTDFTAADFADIDPMRTRRGIREREASIGTADIGDEARRHRWRPLSLVRRLSCGRSARYPRP